MKQIIRRGTVRRRKKYHLKCVNCGTETPTFAKWLRQNQQCPNCGSTYSEVWYGTDYRKLAKIFKSPATSFWMYFDFLPLYMRRNIVSFYEGASPVEKWSFLEEYAKSKYNLDIEVFAYRNDLNGGTGTFKDVAASLAASIFKERRVKQYCIASTGNTATAYAKYLSKAGVNCSVFMPEDSLITSQAFINSYGQRVFKVMGDYAKAKSIANEYAKEQHVLISSGNTDPIRIEAKKTMVFEWLRQIGKLPDVYIQAVSGGTGPLAIDKGIRELSEVRPDLHLPRFILVQSDGCDPMVQAWEKAVASGFPEGWEKDYPVLNDPKTMVPTLATGNPASYPIVAKLVKRSNGAFVRMHENKLVSVGKLIAYEQKVIPGPASAVCVAGFFIALKNGQIKNGDSVMVNIGEGATRAPRFVEQMIYTTQEVNSAKECEPHNISDFREQLWNDLT